MTVDRQSPQPNGRQHRMARQIFLSLFASNPIGEYSLRTMCKSPPRVLLVFPQQYSRLPICAADSAPPDGQSIDPKHRTHSENPTGPAHQAEQSRIQSHFTEQPLMMCVRAFHCWRNWPWIQQGFNEQPLVLWRQANDVAILFQCLPRCGFSRRDDEITQRPPLQSRRFAQKRQSFRRRACFNAFRFHSTRSHDTPLPVFVR